MASKDDKLMEARKSEQLERALRHAAGIGMGWFGLTLLTRQLLDAADTKEKDSYDKKLKAYTSARYPILSPNLSAAASLKEDKAERELGVPKYKNLDELESKTASVFSREKEEGPSNLRVFFDKFLNPVPTNPNEPLTTGNIVSSFTSNKIHPAHIALALTALAGGAATGALVSNSISSKRRGNELDKRISDARSQLDKLLFDEYRRTRNLDKTAREDYDMKDQNTGPLSKILTSIPKLYLLYAAGMGALTYSITKRKLDDSDENRARLKALQEFSKDRAKLSGATQIQVNPSDPTFAALMTPSK